MGGTTLPVPKGLGPEPSQRYLTATESQRYLGPVSPLAKFLPGFHHADGSDAAAVDGAAAADAAVAATGAGAAGFAADDVDVFHP